MIFNFSSCRYPAEAVQPQEVLPVGQGGSQHDGGDFHQLPCLDGCEGRDLAAVLFHQHFSKGM